MFARPLKRTWAADESATRAPKLCRVAEPISLTCLAHGHVYTCKLMAIATVGELRGKASAALDIPAHYIRLFAEPRSFPPRGLQLLDDDAKTLIGAGIGDGSSVHIITRSHD